MGNRISTTQEPVIMTATFLEKIVIRSMVHTQDLDITKLKKLVKIDGLEYDVIFSLDLEHQSLVNIDDLWQFQYLTKLEMPNNLLERIEGLESLIYLQSLDLSFNFIKYISNLENLINLKHLNLTSNEIVVLENMDCLKKLETFLIRHNKIKSFNNIHYLSKFNNLCSLAMDKNPLLQDTEVKFHIISLLPQLKYLDFKVVTSDEVRKAFKLFPPENEKCVSSQKTLHEKFKCSFPDSDKEAYVEGLANGRGFNIFLLSENNYQLLHSSPLVSHISQEKVTEIFDEWHDTGHKYYQQVQQEKSQFLQMVLKAKEYSLAVSREEELKFIAFKEQIPKELCLIYQNSAADDENDKDVTELKKKCESFLQNIFKNLMHSTCLCVDLIFKLCQIYEKEISLLHIKYIQEVENFIKEIMDINKIFADKFQEFYFHIHDSGFDSSEEIKMENGKVFEHDPAFLQLIKKKEMIKITLKLSLRYQSTVLNERINNLKSTLHNDLMKTIDQVTEEGFIRQGEQTKHTVIFYNKQKCFIEKLISKNNIFKHYLGYQ